MLVTETVTKNISLSVVKPKKVKDFYWEKCSDTWSSKQNEALRQIGLFDDNVPSKLEKIPYKFLYHLICEEPGCPGHRMMIEDWEVMELYRKMKDRYGEEGGLLKVKEKFFNQICSSNRDTHFFVGTVLQYGTWIIIGTFWPPRI